MGISTVTAARIYKGQQNGQTGEEAELSFETFPYTGLIKVRQWGNMGHTMHLP